MTEMDFPLFPELPIDLQTNILSIHPETLRKSLFLSKQYLSQMKLKVCSSDITKHELKGYLQSKVPKIFNVYVKSKQSNRSHLLIFNFYKNPTWTLTDRTIIRHKDHLELDSNYRRLGAGNRIHPIKCSIDQIIKILFNDNYFEHEFDVLTFNRILNTRTSSDDIKRTIYFQHKQSYHNIIFLNSGNKYINYIYNYYFLLQYSSVFNLNHDPLIKYDKLILKRDETDKTDISSDEITKFSFQEIMESVNVLKIRIPYILDNIEMFI